MGGRERRVCEYIHARAIHNAVTQGRRVQKGGLNPPKGPSIYDVNTEGEGVRLMWTHVDGGEGGPAPFGRPHRKLKLESTDVILFSSHAKKLASFYQNFVFEQKKVDIFLLYKLVIQITKSIA